MQQEINAHVTEMIEQVQEMRRQASGKLIQIFELSPELYTHGDEYSHQFFTRLRYIYPDRVTIECSRSVNGSFRLQFSIA